ncbi:UBiquitin Conjugating enzyme [Caenorhabditis elegans]|uniref:UBiquitin Conjugating enzyme n=1 Tax=Caenorhabditis elegans TaxID=6239 RepID=Q17720_CAEEL|nr:UBiquitin Conjugating enzyme [Caenorhabditis elegans]CCD63326.1 UBiquitin Conjugating enzyme [Caenorhabditis elegans]|eukprot:NP_509501.2 UBiquitin Conjugating enzyme [Caenorhabditis elegans]
MNENQKRFLDDMEIAQQLYIIEMVNEEDKKITFHIAGPADTPYETGVFEVDLTFPDNYPNALPQIKFQTLIWNCAVEPSTGQVHIENYSRLNVSEALSYIEDLFRSIEVDEEVMFYKTARFWTTEFAGGRPLPDDDWQKKKVDSLIEMGFSRLESILALGGSDWNLADAAEQLLEGDEQAQE